MKTEVEQFIESAQNWQNEMTLLRSILLECPLKEVIKWSMPCYTFNDKNIVIIQNFKNHCDLGFFNGAGLSDPNGLLIKAGKNTQYASQLRFENIQDIKHKKAIIKDYVNEAIEIEKKGIKVMIEAVPKTEPVDELLDIFKKNKAFENAFNALTPGRQRGYHLFFGGAKQTETRISRIEKYIPRILEGKGINDCTCGLSKKMPNCDGSHKLLKTM